MESATEGRSDRNHCRRKPPRASHSKGKQRPQASPALQCHRERGGFLDRVTTCRQQSPEAYRPKAYDFSTGLHGRLTREPPACGDETKKKHGIRHSVELFDVRPVLHPTKIVVTVYNTAPYAYYIKSVMVGETSVQQRARHKWPRGMPADRYAAKRAVGKKRHAFTFLMRSPGRKAGRLLARELQADLVDLIQKEVS